MAPRRGERRVYLGGGVWETMDGTRVPSSAPKGPPPAAPGRPALPRPMGAAPARPHLTRLWPLRVLLTLPLVWGGALAAGLGVYLVAVGVTVGDPGMSDLGLVLCGLGSLAAALVQTLAFGALLAEHLHGRYTFVLLCVAAAGAVGAAVLAVLGYPAAPTLAVAGLLGYAAAIMAPTWALGMRTSAGPGGAVPRPVMDASGRGWTQVGGSGAGYGASGPGGGPFGVSLRDGAWGDAPARWSWEGGHDRGRSSALFALGVLGALVLAGAATAVGFVAFSLFAESFVAGQVELGWQDTLLSTALNGKDGGGVLGVLMLVLANLGCAALFGLLAWAAALCAGGGRGRVALRWAVVLGVLLIAGVVCWLLDGSLPRL